MREHGWYSVLEGVDYAGKSTVIKLAKQFATKHGIDTVFVREPGGTATGARLREIILHGEERLDPMTEALLFLADRHHLMHTTIEPALAEGKHVVSDRDYLSSIIYQGHGSQSISPEVLMALTEQLLPARYVRPDALAVLGLTKATWLRRRLSRWGEEPADAIERSEQEYFDRVYQAYDNVRDIAPWAVKIDAEAEPEVLFERVRPLMFPDFK